VNLLLVLFISWSTGASLSYFKEYELEYQAKCLLMSVTYLILAGFCYYYLLKELKLKTRIDVYLISALCVCMIISSWFNFLFVSPDIYYLLVDMKQGDGLNWKNIYKTVEIIALLTVGRNGLINIYNWFICGSRRHSVIIKHNSTHNTGI
jgi:hypothetical protein